jgi:tetratricopeptide (TPR) repeat protein
MSTTTRRVSAADRRQAEQAYEEGLRSLDAWNTEEALKHFRAAQRQDPANPDYPLAVARGLARSGDYDQALRAVGEYIRIEPEPELSERFERLFAQALDDVESVLTEHMTAERQRLEDIGAAIQMWLEFRITWGRRPLPARKPASWAAALDYTVRKVNGHNAKTGEIAESYGVSEATVRERHQELVEVLDIMPCDYRYFTGAKNPLDKLVEAAQMLEELEEKFRAG